MKEGIYMSRMMVRSPMKQVKEAIGAEDDQALYYRLNDVNDRQPLLDDLRQFFYLFNAMSTQEE